MSAKKPKIEVFEGADGWRFRALGANGEIVAQSEVYADKGKAKRGVKALQKLVVNAEVVEVKIVAEDDTVHFRGTTAG